MDEPDGESTGHEIFMAVLYTIALGIAMYPYLDQLTDGALTVALSEKWYQFKGWAKRNMEMQQDFERSRHRMLFEAYNIVTENGATG